MYLDEEVAVGADPYELSSADDDMVEREVGFYNGEDLKDNTEPWDMTSEYLNYEGNDDVEDLDSEDTESRLIQQTQRIAKEEALASEETSKKTEHKSKKTKKQKKMQKKSNVDNEKSSEHNFDDFEHSISRTAQDDEITQMQQSIDKDQANLQSLMEDFTKKLSDYEDAKVGVETSLGQWDSGEVEVGSSSEDFDLEDLLDKFDSDEIALGSSSDDSDEWDHLIQMFEDPNELPVGIFDDLIDEIPVGESEDYDEIPVGENFDYDEWMEQEFGEMPLEYTHWHEEALGKIEDMEDQFDHYRNPDLELQDFEETLVGDSLEQLHADMNDMFDNILFDSSEDPVGDSWLDLLDDDFLEDPVGEWIYTEEFEDDLE